MKMCHIHDLFLIRVSSGINSKKHAHMKAKKICKYGKTSVTVFELENQIITENWETLLGINHLELRTVANRSKIFCRSRESRNHGLNLKKTN